MDYSKYISTTKDFPVKGILFRDISPLLANGVVFKSMIKDLAEIAKTAKPDLIVGPEARGFIVGSALANELGIGFQPARRLNKLPGPVISESYGLEYGKNTLAMEKSSIEPGQRVVLVDDLLATGGTIKVTKNLIENLGGKVIQALFVIELLELKGRDTLKDLDIRTLTKF